MNDTLAERLAPYRQSYIAEQLRSRGFSTTRNTVYGWAKGERLPDVRVIPALAEILKIDVGDLTRMIANQTVAA